MKNKILIIIMLLISGCSPSISTKVKKSTPAIIKSTMEIDYKANIVDGRIVRAATLDYGSKFYKQVESFNSQGQLVYHDYLMTGINNQSKAQGINSYYIKYTINDGNVTLAEYYDYRNKLVSTEKYSYISGKLSILNKYLDNKLDMSTTFIYDKNNLIKKVQRYPDGRIFKEFDYTYNAQNKINEEIVKTLFRSIDKQTTYMYNDNGYIATETVFYPRDEESVVNTYHYIYDQNNNWIERVKYINDKASVITTRKINYY